MAASALMQPSFTSDHHFPCASSDLSPPLFASFDNRISYTCNPTRRSLRVLAGIQIDRRRYFDDLLKRQLEAEARQAEADLTCPLDCVRDVHTYREFEKVLHDAEEANELVVVDFYNSSCGACKYLLPQLIKLCKKGCGDECHVNEAIGVVFVKHNVRDEYDELTDLARFYSIRAVPMFSFFMNGSRVDQFPTRDRQRLRQALCQILGDLVE